MQFRLTYAGDLFSTGNNTNGGGRTDHKHDIRMVFAPQLKRLWEITPFLRNGERSGPSALITSDGGRPTDYAAPTLAEKHARYGWNFVPLVTRDLDLLCSIDILFLRPQEPGGILRQGDLDGRLKTLLDALAIPDANQEYEHRPPDGWVHVLLEDDRLATKVSVETDQLLELDGKTPPKNFVRLIITVNIRPYEMTLGNMQFG